MKKKKLFKTNLDRAAIFKRKIVFLAGKIMYISFHSLGLLFVVWQFSLYIATFLKVFVIFFSRWKIIYNDTQPRKNICIFHYPNQLLYSITNICVKFALNRCIITAVLCYWPIEQSRWELICLSFISLARHDRARVVFF